jgi:hypothetical protein
MATGKGGMLPGEINRIGWRATRRTMSAFGTKQISVCVASMSAPEVRQASSAQEGHVCF